MIGYLCRVLLVSASVSRCLCFSFFQWSVMPLRNLSLDLCYMLLL